MPIGPDEVGTPHPLSAGEMTVYGEIIRQIDIFLRASKLGLIDYRAHVELTPVQAARLNEKVKEFVVSKYFEAGWQNVRFDPKADNPRYLTIDLTMREKVDWS